MTTWAASSRRANGTLMARGPLRGASAGPDLIGAAALTLGFRVERAKGIEPS
jgi:hypothetical protein